MKVKLLKGFERYNNTNDIKIQFMCIITTPFRGFRKVYKALITSEFQSYQWHCNNPFHPGRVQTTHNISKHLNMDIFCWCIILTLYYMLFRSHTWYILWHSRLRVYIPWAGENITIGWSTYKKKINKTFNYNMNSLQSRNFSLCFISAVLIV